MKGSLWHKFQNIDRKHAIIFTQPYQAQASFNTILQAKERYEVLVLLKKVSSSPQYNLPRIRERAEYFYNKKLGVADATHLAFAEAAADFFISCDDKLIRCGVRSTLFTER
jgi:predicted nucleic acid-binding protein